MECKLKLYQIVTTPWGVQRSCYYGKGDDAVQGILHLVAWSGPGGPAPTLKGARVLQHRGVGSPPTGGVYAIGGSKREEVASGWRGSRK